MSSGCSYYDWTIDKGDWQVVEDESLIMHKKRIKRDRQFKQYSKVLLFLVMFIVLLGVVHFSSNSDLLDNSARAMVDRILIVKDKLKN